MTLDGLSSHKGKKKSSQASLWMQICICPDQSIKGRISMVVFLQQTIAILHSPLKSQPIGRHCQVTECRAERRVLWVQCVQGHACFQLTDRITALRSQVRVTEEGKQTLHFCQSTQWSLPRRHHVDGLVPVLGAQSHPRKNSSWTASLHNSQSLPGDLLYFEIISRLVNNFTLA